MGGNTYDESNDTKKLEGIELAIKQIEEEQLSEDLITDEDIIDDVLKNLTDIVTTEEIKMSRKVIKKTLDILSDLHNTGDDFLVQYLLERNK